MSWQASAVELVLRLAKGLPGGSLAAAEARIERLQIRPKSFVPPARALRGLDVSRRTVAGMPVYELRPEGATPTRRVCYLHGGSYTFEIAGIQWRFICQLAREAAVHVTVPIYPLAPIATAAWTVPAVAEVVSPLVDEHPVTLLGDSAPGEVWCSPSHSTCTAWESSLSGRC